VLADVQPAQLPEMPESWVDMPTKTLATVVERVAWAQDTEQRPTLAGVNLTQAASEATNTHVFARAFPGIIGGDLPVFIPNIGYMRPFLDDDKVVKIAADDRWLWVRGKKWRTFLRRTESAFPDTTPLIFAPAATEHVGFNGQKVRVHSIVLRRSDLLAAVARVGATSVTEDEKRIGAAMRFDMREGGELHVVSNYPIEIINQTIVVDEILPWRSGSVTPDDVAPFAALRHTAIYGVYLRRALQAMRGETVRMLWTDDPVSCPPQWQDGNEKEGLHVAIAVRRVGVV
jgi:hypothetical protein